VSALVLSRPPQRNSASNSSALRTNPQELHMTLPSWVVFGDDEVLEHPLGQSNSEDLTPF